MLKRITCLLAVLIVLCNIVSVNAVSFSEYVTNEHVLSGFSARYYFSGWVKQSGQSLYVGSIVYGDNVGSIRVIYRSSNDFTVLGFEDGLINWTDSYKDKVDSSYSGLSYNNKPAGTDFVFRYNMSIPVYDSTNTLLGYLWPKPDGVSQDDFIDIKDSAYTPNYDLENDWLSQTTNTGEDGKPEEGIYIIAPKDGKVFSSKDSYANITVQYRHLFNPLYINPHINIYASYDGTNFENLDLSFADGLYDLNMVNQNTNVVAYGSDRYFEATITYRLSPRKNLHVTVYCDLMYQKNAGILTQPTLLAESNRVTMTWYDDFVDADGDGVDDRDNQPDYSPSQDYDKDNGVNVDGIKDVTGLLDSTKGSIEGVIGFVKYYFSFIPSQVFTIISASLVICILLRIFGR